MIKQTNFLPVVLIRHAQSEWNLEGRFTGWADPQLTELGGAEARLIRPALICCSRSLASAMSGAPSYGLRIGSSSNGQRSLTTMRLSPQRFSIAPCIIPRLFSSREKVIAWRNRPRTDHVGMSPFSGVDTAFLSHRFRRKAIKIRRLQACLSNNLTPWSQAQGPFSLVPPLDRLCLQH